VTKYIPDEFEVKSFYLPKLPVYRKAKANRSAMTTRSRAKSVCVIADRTCRERCTGFATRICRRKLSSSKYLYPAGISDSNRE